MAHLSLYRKYRPQNFAEVVGQAHVTRTLQTAIEQDRLAHALLFSGPRGTGKTSTARILAKTLNCEKGQSEACGECSSCLQIAGGSSLDVVEIDAASHGSVDDARDLREKVAYSSVGGRWKVYIIDECHMLSPAANNALLKVLEEPPDHVVFVFATTEPQKVLQTVLDRCQRYEFRAVSALDTAGRLAQVCEMEGITAVPEVVTLIANRAGGSVRDALSLLDQLRAFAGDTIEVADLAELLGKMPADLLYEAVDLVSERAIGAVFELAERLIRSGVDIREFSRALTEHLRSLFMVLHAPAAREILDVTDDELTRLQEQANHLGSAEVLRLIDLSNEIGLQMRQSVEARLALEVGLARMTRPDLHPSPAALLTRIERLEKALERAGMYEGTRLGRAGGEQVPPPQAPPAVRPAAQETVGAPGPAGGRPDAPAPPQPAAPAQPAASKASPASVPAAQAPGTTAASGPSSGATGSAPADARVAEPPQADTAGPLDQRSGGPSEAPEPTTGAEDEVATPDRQPDQPQAPTVPAGELELDTIVRAWPQIRDKVKRRKISFHAVLLPAEPVAWRDGELVLEFDSRSRFHRDKVADRTAQIPLLEAFAEVLGVTPRLRCVLGKEPAPQAPARAAEVPPDEGEPPDEEGTEAAEDAVELIRRAFKGTVVVEDP